MNPPSSSSACRCWGWIASSGGRTTGRRSGTHGLGSVSVEGVPSGGGIDREHHSARTVATLSTVNPNRTCVVHRNGESGEGGGIGTNRFESRIEAVHHRTARTGEGGLGSRMVFLVELEGDGVSRLGNDGAGLERENTSTTDDDAMVRPRGGSR